MIEQLIDEQLAGIASLADERRRTLYRYVVEQGRGVGRDEAAATASVSRSLAAYHLDRLVSDGLLTARYERTSGRRGPGAGRPAKLYERAARSFQVHLPPRDYELAARLLARGLDPQSGADPSRAVLEAARDFGAQLGTGARSRLAQDATLSVRGALCEAIKPCGYEPIDTGSCIRLRNCPFDSLAAEHRDLICGMNLALLQGVLSSLTAELEATLEPNDTDCCVTIRSESSSSFDD